MNLTRFSALASVFLAALPALAGPGDTKSFTLLHTNDQHGHLLPFSYPDRVSPSEDVARMPFVKDIGGIARRATLVKKIKSATKNCYLLDAGDCMDGTAFSAEFFAKADYDAMNLVGYDYGVFGNHDFNMTGPQFTSLMQTVKFPLLLANATNKSDGKNPLPPYKIVVWDGLKVALFGLVTKSTESYTAAKALYKIDDPVEVAKKLVPELRKQADLVIGITHVGLDVDKELAQKVAGIDVLVGAHSHTRLPVGVYETTFKPGPGDPKGTVIVQDHQWVGELGRLDLTVMQGRDGRWRVSRFAEQLIPITKEIPEDPAVAKVVAGYWKQDQGEVRGGSRRGAGRLHGFLRQRAGADELLSGRRRRTKRAGRRSGSGEPRGRASFAAQGQDHRGRPDRDGSVRQPCVHVSDHGPAAQEASNQQPPELVEQPALHASEERAALGVGLRARSRASRSRIRRSTPARRATYFFERAVRRVATNGADTGEAAARSGAALYQEKLAAEADGRQAQRLQRSRPGRLLRFSRYPATKIK